MSDTPNCELTARDYFVNVAILELALLEHHGTFIAEAVASFRHHLESLLPSLSPMQLEYVCDQLRIHNRQAKEFSQFRDHFADHLAGLTKYIPTI
jgi:hypothetical protein